MTFGIAESALSKMLDEWEDALPSDMHLAYLPDALTGVRLRLSIYGGAKEEQEARIEAEMRAEVFSFTIRPGETIFDVKKNLVEVGYSEEEIEKALDADYDFDFLKEYKFVLAKLAKERKKPDNAFSHTNDALSFVSSPSGKSL